MECELMGQMTWDISPSVAAVTLAFVVETDGREEPLPSGQNDCGRHRRCFLYGGVAKNPPKVNTLGKTGNGRMMGDSCHPGVFCFLFFIRMWYAKVTEWLGDSVYCPLYNPRATEWFPA